MMHAPGGEDGAPAASTGGATASPPERFRFSRCRACGLVFLDPRVPAGALGPYYPESYLPYRGPEAWGRWRALVAAGLRATDRRRVERVRRHHAVGPRSRVLDVGCGRPTFLEALVAATGCHGTGTDFSDGGWRDDPERWRGLELVRGDLRECAPPGPWDVVTMWHYLEHDYAPVETLRRLRERVDRAGAGGRRDTTLVVEVPDHGSWSRRRYGRFWAGYHTPRHTALWDRRTIRVLLERSGWRVETVEEEGTLDPWALVWMSRQERRGLDWSASMAPRFPGFVAGRAVLWPLLSAWERWRGRGGDGLLTAVARPA